MCKMVGAVLLFLIGLALLAGGITAMGTLYMTSICLIIAGILTIILAIAMAMMKKHEMMAPAK